MRWVVGVVLAALVLAAPATADAARLARTAGGFDSPVYATKAFGALYVVEQEGQIWRRRAGRLTLFLDIRGEVRCCGEEGLLSLAFDGAYPTNRFIYVNYVNNNSNLVFARFRANSTGTRVPASSFRAITRVAHPGAGNHNGGQVVWGPEGRLYMSTGDGGGGCDPDESAQDTSSLLGKVFSVNPRNLAGGLRLEIYGVRNPWRFSFDRATSRFYLGDVGQQSWEEINTQANVGSGALANYGWDVFEGFQFNTCGSTTLRGPAGHHPPIDVYSHSLGCSVTGGFVYRGRTLGWLRGWYLYADYCSGRIWRLLFRNGRLEADRRLLMDTGHNISSFGETAGGEILVVAHGGTVYQLVPNR
jgi:glucose/arabinose dehydrogenase